MSDSQIYDFRPKFFTKYFLRHRKIFIWGPIDVGSSYLAVTCLKYLSNKSLDPIYIYINSEGGEVEAATSVLDEIERIKEMGILVYTIAVGAAYSCAAFLLMAGTKGYRTATPNSTILIHLMSYELGFDKATTNKNYSDFADKQNESLLKLIAGYCGKNTNNKLKKFREQIDQDLWLSAAEAKKYGVVDNIGDI